MPWNLIISAVVTTAPQLLAELMALYDRARAGTPVTEADWIAFEAKYLNASAEQRLLAIARRMS